MERTFILIKPDAVMRGLLGTILSKFEDKGFRIDALKMVHISDNQLFRLYPTLTAKPFFGQVKGAMQCGPCIALVLSGHEAVKSALIICGTERNPEDNAPGTIRFAYALWTGADVVHRAKTRLEAEEQIAIFFDATELFRYDRCDARFLSEEGWIASSAIEHGGG